MWQGELYIYLPANFGYAQDWTGVSEPRSQEQAISVIIIVVVVAAVIIGKHNDSTSSYSCLCGTIAET